MIQLEIHTLRQAHHKRTKAAAHSKNAQIVSAIDAVSSSGKEARSPIQKAFRRHYDCDGSDEAIQDLASFHLTCHLLEHEWNELFIACDPLQKGLIPDAARVEILKAAAKLPKDRWSLFQKAANHFDIENWSVESRLDLLNILLLIDPNDESIFLETQALSQGLSGKDALLILRNLLDVPKVERNDVVTRAKAEINPGMPVLERVERLQTAEAACWESPLVRPDMSGKGKLQLKRAVEAISGKGAPNGPKRIDWIARSLTNSKMGVEDIIAILKEAASHQLKFGASNFKQFISAVAPFVILEEDTQYKIAMIHKFAEQPQNQYGSIALAFNSLTEFSMKAPEKLLILNAVILLSSEIRSQLHSLIFGVLQTEMTAEDRVSILNAYSQLPLEMRQKFFQLKHVFKSPNPQDVCQMLQALSQSEVDIERLLIASKLIEPEMSFQDRMKILNCIPPLPSPQDRQFIVEQTESKIEEDMDIEEKVLVLSTICLICSALKNHPLFSEWLIPYLIDEVFMQLHLNPEDLDINGHIELLSADEIVVNVDQLKENPLLFLEQVLHLYDGQKTLPKIQYETDVEVDPVGTDLGGTSRDFVTKLMQSLLYPPPLAPRLIPIKETEKGFMPAAEDPSFYKMLGMLFAASLNRSSTLYMKLPLGKHFHPVLFNMLYSLTQQGMAAIPPHFANLNELPEALKNQLLKIYLKEEMPLVFGAPAMSENELQEAVNAFVDEGTVNEWMENMGGVTTKAEFLEERGLNPILLAVFTLASSMYQRLKIPAQWDTIKEASFEALRSKIEGDLSKDAAKLAFEHLQTDDPRKEWLLQWIDAASPQKLEDFVFCISGATVLSSHQKFRIDLQPPSSKMPSFHTCFYTIDIPEYDSYEVFREKLNTAIEYIKAGNGIGLA